MFAAEKNGIKKMKCVTYLAKHELLFLFCLKCGVDYTHEAERDSSVDMFYNLLNKIG